MSAAAHTPVGYDALQDKSYLATTLGRDIADFLAWGQLGGWSQKTLVNYEPDLVRPAAALGLLDKSMDQLTGSDLLRIAQFFPGSHRTRMAPWKTFYKWGRRTRRVTVNPCDELPDFKTKPQPHIPVFTTAEIEALYALPIKDAAPIAVMIEAGLRKDEASNLRLRDCQPETGRVIVLKGKGDKSRVVPMSPRLQQHLAEIALLERLNPDDHIYYAVLGNQTSQKKILRGKPVGAATFARWWRRCLKDAGVEYRNPHVARHTCATRWRQDGLAIDDIQVLLGHASIHTTQSLYVHTAVNDIERRMREIGLAV